MSDGCPSSKRTAMSSNASVCSAGTKCESMPSTPAQGPIEFISRVASNPTPRSSAKGSKRRALVGLVTGAIKTLKGVEKEKCSEMHGVSTLSIDAYCGNIAPATLLSSGATARQGSGWTGLSGECEGIVYIAWKESQGEGQSSLLLVYESGSIAMLNVTEASLERDREVQGMEASLLPFAVSLVCLCASANLSALRLHIGQQALSPKHAFPPTLEQGQQSQPVPLRTRYLLSVVARHYCATSGGPKSRGRAAHANKRARSLEIEHR